MENFFEGLICIRDIPKWNKVLIQKTQKKKVKQIIYLFF